MALLSEVLGSPRYFAAPMAATPARGSEPGRSQQAWTAFLYFRLEQVNFPGVAVSRSHGFPYSWPCDKESAIPVETVSPNLVSPGLAYYQYFTALPVSFRRDGCVFALQYAEDVTQNRDQQQGSTRFSFHHRLIPCIAFTACLTSLKEATDLVVDRGR